MQRTHHSHPDESDHIRGGLGIQIWGRACDVRGWDEGDSQETASGVIQLFITVMTNEELHMCCNNLNVRTEICPSDLHYAQRHKDATAVSRMKSYEIWITWLMAVLVFVQVTQCAPWLLEVLSCEWQILADYVCKCMTSGIVHPIIRGGSF